MKIKQIINEFEKFAPLSLAESWDNVGLIVGDENTDTKSVVLCLDINQKVLDKCIRNEAKLCICHHPFLFDEFNRIDFKDPFFQILGEFIKNNIAIYASHTNLDSCVGGVNDALASVLELKPTSTFIKDLEFEETNTNIITPGLGRIVKLETPMNLFDIYKKTINNLKIPAALVNFDEDKKIDNILIASGSYSNEWNNNVLQNHIDLIITGEIKHNDLMVFERNGVCVICAGHDATERVILRPLADILSSTFPDLKFDVSLNLDYNILSSE